MVIFWGGGGMWSHGVRFSLLTAALLISTLALAQSSPQEPRVFRFNGCWGVVISEYRFITAAHCVRTEGAVSASSSVARVRFGERVALCSAHALASRSGYDYDVAVCRRLSPSVAVCRLDAENPFGRRRLPQSIGRFPDSGEVRVWSAFAGGVGEGEPTALTPARIRRSKWTNSTALISLKRCFGDSGAPVFAGEKGEQLVGLVVGGTGLACSGETVVLRLEQVADFIQLHSSRPRT